MKKVLGVIVGKVLEFPMCDDLTADNADKFQDRFYTLLTDADIGMQGMETGAYLLSRHVCEFATDLPDDELIRRASDAYNEARRTWRLGKNH